MFNRCKVWFISLILILALVALVACVPNNKDIYGSYQYEETIYNNPASSFIMTKENADNYIITNGSITIQHPDGTREQVAASFQKSEVDIDAFGNLFIAKVWIPDISSFEQRYQYSINEKYRLYAMDDEIWLAQCPGDTMWSIYRLIKVKPTS